MVITWTEEKTTTNTVQSDKDENQDGVIDENDTKTESTTATVEVGVVNENVTFTAE